MPFILAVPTGRWVEKKVKSPPFRVCLDDTVVKNALENKRVLNFNTLKKLVAQSTAKKENIAQQSTAPKKFTAVKSKKKILGELNAVIAPQVEAQPVDSPTEPELNSTFEILSESIDEPILETPAEMPTLQQIQQNRRSKSMSVIVRDVAKVEVPKTLTPPVKKAPQAQQKKTIAKNKLVATKPAATKKVAPKPVVVKPVARKPVKVSKKPENLQSIAVLTSSDDALEQSFESPENVPELKKVHSRFFNIYNVSIKNAFDFLTMRINEIMGNKEQFMDLLTEDQQTFINQTSQLSKLILNDKLNKFREVLDKFEFEHENSPTDPKRVTEDDVENYWYLLYDEIENLKKDLNEIHEMKKSAFAMTNSTKKRRTRRTYVPDEGTPKRSRRIADNADTPK